MLRSSILLLFLLALPARANLGETVEQCVARYGKPVAFAEASPKFPFGTVTFVAGNYALVIFVANDREVGARVSKIDKTAFAEAEMQNIMTADADTPWKPTPSDDPTCLQWSRSDQATVLYDKEKHILIFTSPEMAAAASAAPDKPTH